MRKYSILNEENNIKRTDMYALVFKKSLYSIEKGFSIITSFLIS